MLAQPNRGFTLIELVMVIVLLGIVSVYAASRYVGKSSFDAQLLEQEVLSSLRLTQLRAMNRSGLCSRWLVDSNRAIHVSPSVSSASCVLVFPSDTSDSSFVDASSEGVQLSLTTEGAQNYLDFDNLGRSAQCVNSACSVSIQGQSGDSRLICINTEGGIFATSSTC